MPSLLDRARAVFAFAQVHILYGCELPALARLLARNRFAVAPERWPVVILAICASFFNSFLSLFCRMVFAPRTHRTTITPGAVFVLGHWRSGTTFLHELLATDHQFISPTGYQCFVPGHFLVSEPVLKPLVSVFLPAKRPMDDMPLDLSAPQEDEFALLNLDGRSNYAGFMFPRNQPSSDLAEALGAEDESWQAHWMYFLQSLQMKAGPNRRLLLKSPQHTARVATILSLMPDAKFVHISREPHRIYASTMRTWRTMAERCGLQDPSAMDPWLNDHVIASLNTMYRHYDREHRLIPRGNHVEIAYEDLVARPVETLAQVYEALGLGDFARVAPAIQARLGDRAAHQVARYADDAAARAVTDRHWAAYRDRFGYGTKGAEHDFPVSAPLQRDPVGDGPSAAAMPHAADTVSKNVSTA